MALHLGLRDSLPGFFFPKVKAQSAGERRCFNEANRDDVAATDSFDECVRG